MRILPAILLSLSLAPVVACGGAAATKADTTADLPPMVDCGLTIDALAPVMETPAVVLVGETPAQVPRLVGDLACQVAAGGHAVVVAIEPEDKELTKELIARVEVMRAAGLEVVISEAELAGFAKLAADHPDARLIALAGSVDDIRDVPAYAINVVGESGATPPALRANAAREGGFDAVLDLGASAAAPDLVPPSE